MPPFCQHLLNWAWVVFRGHLTARQHHDLFRFFMLLVADAFAAFPLFLFAASGFWYSFWHDTPMVFLPSSQASITSDFLSLSR